jgi:hypothetical protein
LFLFLWHTSAPLQVEEAVEGLLEAIKEVIKIFTGET